MLDKKDFQIEEYKLVKARIVSIESRREQTIVLQITALAAILGFSDNISDVLIPYMVLVILLISSTSYSFYLILQNLNTAYLIERYESVESGLSIESGYLKIILDKSIRNPILKVVMFFSDPFLWLTVISVSMSSIFGYRFWYLENMNFQNMTFIFYFSFLFLGHIISIFSSFIRGYMDIEYFRNEWREILNCRGDICDFI